MILASQKIHKLIVTLASNGFRKHKLLQLVISTISKTNYPAVKFKVKDLVNALQGMFTNNLNTYFLVEPRYMREPEVVYLIDY